MAKNHDKQVNSQYYDKKPEKIQLVHLFILYIGGVYMYFLQSGGLLYGKTKY